MEDYFWLILTLLMALVFIVLGWRNYNNPERHGPLSPLGKYFVTLAENQVKSLQNETASSAARFKMLRLEGFFFMLGGALMLITMAATLFLVS